MLRRNATMEIMLRKKFGALVLILVITLIVVIAAAGCLVFFKKSWPVAQRPDSSSQPQTKDRTSGTTTTGKLAGWLKYTDSLDNYAIEYPQAWEREDTSGNDVIFLEGKGRWPLGIFVTDTTKTLEQSVDAEKAVKSSEGFSIMATSTVVGGQPATRISLGSAGVEGSIAAHYNGTTDNGDTETLIVHGGKLYVIWQGPGSTETESAVLKTFQFVN
jgi:hypothetical protein